MTTAILTMAEYASYTKRLASGFMPAARRGLVAAAQGARTMLVRSTDRAVPASERGASGAVNSGHFKSRWIAEERGGDTIHIENSTPYAGVIEGGRRAGGRFPPRAAIAAWAMRRMHLSEMQAKSAAFLIARAIAKRGLQPRHVMASAMPGIAKLAHAELQSALRQAMQGGHR